MHKVVCVALAVAAAACTPYAPMRLHSATPDDLAKLDTQPLCFSLYDGNYPNVAQELLRRSAIRPEMADLIDRHAIKVGMTPCEVGASWGYPSHINDSGGAYGATAQWVFGDPLYGAQYVYFRNGTVESWQSSN